LAGRLIVISGPSGSGKTSIIRRLLDRVDIVFSVSATTRPPRPGETQGVDYNFVTTEEFEEMIARDALLEWAIYDGNHYGTPSDPVAAETAAGRDVLLDIEIEGARQVRAQRPDALMIFVSPPSTEVLRRRLRSRGDTSSRDIASRLKIAESQLEEAPGLFDHIVVNEDLEHAIDDVADLIIGS
jgi:guanylate kinase